MRILILWLACVQLLSVRSFENGDSDLLSWPAGTYGLPEPTSGCPSGDSWSSGSVYQNTEDELNSNKHSVSFHSRGRFSEQGIELGFCIKDAENSSTRHWPPGKYCLYKHKKCPENFKEGEIFWQDEKSSNELPNQHSGSLPDGIYNLTGTLIKFCCREDGNTSRPIELPTDNAFYLFPAAKKCQQVTGMEVALEWIHFDDEDEGNTDYISGKVPYGTNPQEDYNIILRLCYYTEKEEKVLKMDQEPTQTRMGINRSTALGVTAGAGALLVVTGIVALLKLKVFKHISL